MTVSQVKIYGYVYGQGVFGLLLNGYCQDIIYHIARLINMALYLKTRMSHRRTRNLGRIAVTLLANNLVNLRDEISLLKNLNQVPRILWVEYRVSAVTVQRRPSSLMLQKLLDSSRISTILAILMMIAT